MELKDVVVRPRVYASCKGEGVCVVADWSYFGNEPVLLIGDTKWLVPEDPDDMRLFNEERIVADEDTWLDLLHIVTADGIRFGDLDEQHVELEAVSRNGNGFLLIISIGDGDYLWFGRGGDGALVEHLFDAEELDSFFDDARQGKYDRPDLVSLRAGRV